MPLDSNGNYTLLPQYFVEAGDTVLPSQHNPVLEDMAGALNLALYRNGAAPWTASQNANNNRLTNLAPGINPNDAATVSQIVGGVPIGSVVDFAGLSPPSDWRLCDGSAVSRSTFSSLFAILGTSFGDGDGSTTFNLPDLRDRVSIGRGGMGGTAANRITTAVSGFDSNLLGASGGEQSQTLTLSQIPSHSHGGATSASGSHTHTAGAAGGHTPAGIASTAGSHTHSATATSAGAHTHTAGAAGGRIRTGGAVNADAGDGGFAAPVARNSVALQRYYDGKIGNPLIVIDAPTINSAGAHTHSVSVADAGAHTHTLDMDAVPNHTHSISTAPNHTHSITAEGGGSFHRNIQPSIVLSKIIKVF